MRDQRLRKTRSHRSRAAAAQDGRPWWEQSPRLRLLTFLSNALERGEHEHAAASGDAAHSSAATAALLVRGLLTSSRQGAVTQNEALACATALSQLCVSDARAVVDACGGQLERWAVERLDSLWDANTERAAHLELQLIELLGLVCDTPNGRKHMRELHAAAAILGRMVHSQLVGGRAKALLGRLERDTSRISMHDLM